MNFLQMTPAFSTVAMGRDVHVALVGKSATDRKMSAVAMADEVSLVALSHGTGKVAKLAAAGKADAEFNGVVAAIANGNLQAFAVKVAGVLGENVKFGKRDADGNVIVKASDDFKNFGGVLAHKMLQLEDKNKVFTAAGKYTSAAADLSYLISLHGAVVRKMDERDAKDAARRAALALEQEAEAQAEKGATVEA